MPDPPVAAGASPVGLDNDGSGNLLGTSIGTVAVFSFNPANGSPVSGPFAATGTPLGITTDGSTLYVNNAATATVDSLTLTGSPLSSFDVSAFATFPEGLARAPFDDNLYVVDGAGGNQVGRFSPAGAQLATFPINGSSPDGIAWDDARCVFWIYDSGTDTVRSYDSGFAEIQTFPGSIAAGFSAGEGVGVIGDSLYVMATGASTLVQFDITGATPAANAAALCPRGPAPLAGPVPALNRIGLASLILLLLAAGFAARRQLGLRV